MYNTIAQLQRISVKPKSWIAIPSHKMSTKREYVLAFNHKSTDEPTDFSTVQNARGKTKYYKTLEALLKDVYLVDRDAAVIVKAPI